MKVVLKEILRVVKNHPKDFNTIHPAEVPRGVIGKEFPGY